MACLSLAIGATAFAQQDFSSVIGARQGEMRVLSLNLGILGNMARGNIDYDAGMAQIAADNLVAISMLHQEPFWPAGSDNGAAENTRALPAIWEDQAGFAEDWSDLGTAATGLQAVAGDGLDALRGAMGPMGGACGACHDDFRQPR
ncbi:cytochrome c [Rhodophyticola sp. CCM32]|uniref:c-type cytochrome n=1 Tax=Rhodophyticola sp. CCM32 TaxID=2916397 RepID=UPI00107F56E7|nr:cytochrome c [Rhodophyticola sp. CCM32]QBY00266.1 cytochrome c [Rhodophyticola sp. CCM32]